MHADMCMHIQLTPILLLTQEQPLVSSDFKGTDYSNSVDAALTMVMGEDLVKVVMWYDNEWGYSQRVLDLCAIVADKLETAAPAAEKEPHFVRQVLVRCGFVICHVWVVLSSPVAWVEYVLYEFRVQIRWFP